MRRVAPCHRITPGRGRRSNHARAPGEKSFLRCDCIFLLTAKIRATHNYAVECIVYGCGQRTAGLGKQKRFRQGQILKLISERSHVEPGRSAAAAGADEAARDPGDALARHRRAEAGEDRRRATSRWSRAARKLPGAAAAGARGAGISAGRSPGGQSAGAEDAAGRRAAAGRGGG